MTGQEYFGWTLGALVLAGPAQFLFTRWWLNRSRRIDPGDCDRKHSALDERLTKGDGQFESILLTLGRMDERDVTKSLILLRICDALNVLLPKDQRIPCDDLIDTLRKS